jgi:hypothetical protein
VQGLLLLGLGCALGPQDEPAAETPVSGRHPATHGGRGGQQGDDDSGPGDTGPDDTDPDGAAPTGLVITEIMRFPTLGEPGSWFEVTNTAARAADTRALVVEGNGGRSFGVAGPAIPPGGRRVFGASGDPGRNGGVAVDQAWLVSLALDGTTGHLALRANGAVIDSVSWDPSFPHVAGRAMALDPAASDAAANDYASAWCVATTRYGTGDRGTPGDANPACM